MCTLPLAYPRHLIEGMSGDAVIYALSALPGQAKTWLRIPASPAQALAVATSTLLKEPLAERWQLQRGVVRLPNALQYAAPHAEEAHGPRRKRPEERVVEPIY